MKKTSPTSSTTSVLLLLITIVSSFLYTLLEWLFLVTKPSFMSILNISDKVIILLYSGCLLSSLCVILLIPIILLKSIPVLSKFTRILNNVGLLLSTAILTSLVLLLVDNFTYTVFKFGIANSVGIIRVMYAVLYLIIGVGILRQLIKFSNTSEHSVLKTRESKRFIVYFAVGLLVIFTTSIFPILKRYSQYEYPASEGDISSDMKVAPHILLITADSLDASYMSLYGYSRETTPFLTELSKTSLLAMNAFSNAQGTTGSITSILTGKYPTDTRVIYAPDILRGEDSYQHLPGILKSYGYYTVQLSFNFYVDAYDLNFLEAFDEANGRSFIESSLLLKINKVLPTNNAYFVYEIGNRLFDRIRHIFFIKDMENPYQKLTESIPHFNDGKKLEYLISLIKSSQQPLFIHLHWLGTHGPTYDIKNQVFSKGQKPDSQGNYNVDFYADSILEFDHAISTLWSELTALDIQQKIILAIASDHSQKWTVTRLPFLIRFPNADHAKVVFENVQNLDIAPTILDYLGIDQPSWMDGLSLLSPVDMNRPIFIASVGQTTQDDDRGYTIHKGDAPPFYQFGRLAVVICDDWFEVNLVNLETKQGKVENYTSVCDAEDLTRLEAYDFIVEHLQANGFDTSSLDQLH